MLYERREKLGLAIPLRLDSGPSLLVSDRSTFKPRFLSGEPMFLTSWQPKPKNPLASRNSNRKIVLVYPMCLQFLEGKIILPPYSGLVLKNYSLLFKLILYLHFLGFQEVMMMRAVTTQQMKLPQPTVSDLYPLTCVIWSPFTRLLHNARL